MRYGYINFKLLIIPIAFEILIPIISICAFHDRHSSNINSRYLNLITFLTFVLFMERLMGGKVFRIWKNMHFVFVTFIICLLVAINLFCLVRNLSRVQHHCFQNLLKSYTM